MKKIAKLMTVLAMTAFTFTGCEDVPNPFGTVTPPSDEEPIVITPSGSGTAADPYNVAGVIEATQNLAAGETTTSDYYVTGYVVNVYQFNERYNSLSYYIADDEDGLSEHFYVYSGSGLNGAAFSSTDDLPLGTKVTVCGKITNYNGTIEFQSQNKIVEWNGETGGGNQPSAEAMGSGTLADPYNIAGVVQYVNSLGSDVNSPNQVYIKGKISEIKNEYVDDNFGNATFYISDDGTTANQFYCYRTLYLGNQKYTTGQTQIKTGDDVIICGNVVNYRGNTPETVQNAAYLYSLNGKTEAGNDNPPTPQTGEAKGSGTQADPYNVVAITQIASKLGTGQTSESDYYFKGKISTIKYSYDAAHGTGTFFVSDDGTTTGEFQVYSALFLGNQNWVDGNTQIKIGDEVVICGKITNYNGTLETASKKAYIYSLNGKTSDEGGNTGGGETGGSSTASSLTNGDFETWADGLPTGWKSASSASSATLSQSTDAHGGKYSVNVNGKPASNVRLASQEMTLAAGNYTFSFWVKPTSANPAQVRPGYVPVTDGKVGSYTYGDYATLSSGWQQINYDFTLSEETTLCLLVMNPKQSSYSSGEDVLVDDATLTKK